MRSRHRVRAGRRARPRDGRDRRSLAVRQGGGRRKVRAVRECRQDRRRQDPPAARRCRAPLRVERKRRSPAIAQPISSVLRIIRPEIGPQAVENRFVILGTSSLSLGELRGCADPGVHRSTACEFGRCGNPGVGIDMESAASRHPHRRTLPDRPRTSDRGLVRQVRLPATSVAENQVSPQVLGAISRE